MAIVGNDPYSRRVGSAFERGDAWGMDDSGSSRIGRTMAGGAVAAAVVIGSTLALSGCSSSDKDKDIAPATLSGYDGDSVTFGVGEADSKEADQFTLLETDENKALVDSLRQQQAELTTLDESTNENVIARGVLAGKLSTDLNNAKNSWAGENAIYEEDGETVKPEYAERHGNLVDEISEYNVIATTGSIAKLLPEAGITTEKLVDAVVAGNVEYLSGIYEQLNGLDIAGDEEAASVIANVNNYLNQACANALGVTTEEFTAEAEMIGVDPIHLYEFKTEHGITAAPFSADAEAQSRDGNMTTPEGIPRTGELECSVAVAECVFNGETPVEDAIASTKAMAAYNPNVAAQTVAWLGAADPEAAKAFGITNVGDKAFRDGMLEENDLAQRLRNDPELYKQVMTWINKIMSENNFDMVALDDIRISTGKGDNGNLETVNAFSGGHALQLTLKDGRVVKVTFRGECCQITMAGQIIPYVAPTPRSAGPSSMPTFHGGGGGHNGGGGNGGGGNGGTDKWTDRAQVEAAGETVTQLSTGGGDEGNQTSDEQATGDPDVDSGDEDQGDTPPPFDQDQAAQ